MNINVNDIKNITYISSKTAIGSTETNFFCEVNGEKKKLLYETYRHDDGYGFGLYINGIGVHNEMPQRDALELEDRLRKIIEAHSWIEKIKKCDNLEELDCIIKDFNENSYLRNDDVRLVLEVFDAKEFELEVGIRCVDAVAKLTTESIKQIEWYADQMPWGDTRIYSISAYLKCLQDMGKITRDDGVNLCMFYEYGIIAKYDA